MLLNTLRGILLFLSVSLCGLPFQERDELLTTMAAVEKERDFYFDKLRDIELLFQAREKGRDQPTTRPPTD